jgi:hypothetical protein
MVEVTCVNDPCVTTRRVRPEVARPGTLRSFLGSWKAGLRRPSRAAFPVSDTPLERSTAARMVEAKAFPLAPPSDIGRLLR